MAVVGIKELRAVPMVANTTGPGAVRAMANSNRPGAASGMTKVECGEAG